MKKGFTLVELLAVIVVLAIIALIAIPIVANIVSNSVIEGRKRSVDLYGRAVQQAIADYQLHNKDDENITVEKIKPYIKISDNTKVECDIQINDGRVGLTECSVDNKEVRDENTADGYYHFGTVIEKIAHVVINSDYGVDYDQEKGLQRGNEVEVKVKKGTSYTFYVLDENVDVTVNLILNNNICYDENTKKGGLTDKNNQCKYSWHSGEESNNYGPDTAMTELYNATKDWNYIKNMELDYKDENSKQKDSEGYIGIKSKNGVAIIEGKNGKPNVEIGTSSIPLKARLPKLSEIYNKDDTTGKYCTSTKGSCPVWLMENLKYSDISDNKYIMNNGEQQLENINGYWLLPSYPDYIRSAYFVHYVGVVYDYYHSGILTKYGLRPVITISKNSISLGNKA